MLYAYLNKELNGKLSKPFKYSKGYCPDCGEELISKCGDINIHHWSHKNLNNCDSKYEGISEWHIKWQNEILNPIGGINVEVPVVITEKYKRADLKPNHGIIIEFQKSPISLNEIKIRELHYKKMMWVIHSDIKNSKGWRIKNSNIPVFIDYGAYLTCNEILDNKAGISRELFISNYINNNGLKFEDIDTKIMKIKRENIIYENKRCIWIKKEQTRLKIEEQNKQEKIKNEQIIIDLLNKQKYIQEELYEMFEFRNLYKYYEYLLILQNIYYNELYDHYKKLEEILYDNYKLNEWKDSHKDKKQIISIKIKTKGRQSIMYKWVN